MPGTRDRILSAALECFLDPGYEQTTIARIRERSGVTNGALFHHFPTKDAIAEALYVDAMRSYQDGLRELLRRKPRSLRAAVRGTIAHQLEWTESNADRARFVYQRGRVDWQSPAGAELEDLNRTLSAEYREWLSPLVAAGKVRPMPMVMLVAIVNGPAHTIAQRWLAGELDGSLTAYTDPLAEAALAGLGASPGTPRRTAAPIPQEVRVRVELVDAGGDVTRSVETSAPVTLDAAP